MMKALRITFALSLMMFMSTGLAGPALAQQELDRTVLPIPDPEYKPITELDARKAKAPPGFEVKPPKDAPNVVIVLIDVQSTKHERK